MGTLTEARIAVAEAVTSAGIECTAYAPESLNPPAAFVDSLNVDLTTGIGLSFCLSGMATGQIVTVAQRNDRAGATQYLEDLAKPIIEALDGVDGLRVTAADSGTVEVAGQSLPSVVYSIEFGIGIT